LIQEDISEPQSRRVFAELSTEVLTIEDVVEALSEVIDNEEEGYHRLPFVSARSEGIRRIDAYTSLRKERADKAYMISNGKNTIYMLDYVVKAQRIYHDPVLCIIGPEAKEIAQLALKNLSRLLLPKMYSLKFRDEAIKDFSNLTGYRKADVIKMLSETFEEAEIALKMNLLKDHMDKVGSSPRRSGSLSREIIKDIRRKPPRVEPLDLRNAIPFGILLMLMMLLLIVLMRL